MRQPHLRLCLSSGVSMFGLVSCVMGEGGLGGATWGVVSEDGSWVESEEGSWAGLEDESNVSS